MNNSSQNCVNGSMPPNCANTDTHTDRVVLPAQRILAYITAVGKGDAPVTTLLQQQSTEAEPAARRAKVQREVDAAMDMFNQASTKYVSFQLLAPKKLNTCL
ncbi:hypothetical protein F5Y06DRAFT_205124 [Hypoxylon sp. FL0890]|nr:hypothetical protein F5Y06DRAFT_205124 [Hypoxylon sp. FL0890]